MSPTTHETASRKDSAATAGESPALSVVMVSYNTRELTLKALDTLYRHAGYPLEVIVLDNASQDGSADAIEARFPEVRLIRSPENLGFARANNVAVGYAPGEVLLLLNPDTEMLPDAVRHLMRLREQNPDAGIWGGRTVYADGSPNPSSCWKRQTLWSLAVQATGLSSIRRQSAVLNPERVLTLDSQAPTPVDIVSGCMLLIDKRLFEQLGGFSPRFFMYGEDADLCLRARDKGARPLVSARPTIVHHGGGSERVPADKLVRLLAAKATLILEHFPAGKRRAGLVMLAAWPFTRMLAHRMLSLVGRRQSTERAEVWANVWARRSEWFAGFPEERQ